MNRRLSKCEETVKQRGPWPYRVGLIKLHPYVSRRMLPTTTEGGPAGRPVGCRDAIHRALGVSRVQHGDRRNKDLIFLVAVLC